MSIESKLRGSGIVKPRRELRADFTHHITERIAAQHRRERYNPKEFFMKLLDKPAIALAAIVATVAISGTAYAAVANWPSIAAMFSGEQKVKNGRIVKVDTVNCHTDNAFTIVKPKDQRGGSRYFMVKEESKLSNEQITQMVLGNCEQGAQADVLMGKLKSQGNNVVGGYIDNVITGISPTSITVEADMPIGNEIKRFTKTFNRIDPAVEVFYKADTLKFSDLKVGDRVGYVYRAEGNALTHSETTSPDMLNTNEATIVMIIKNTPAVADAIAFQKYVGAEFEEVTPCSSDATGYCGIAEYHSHKQ